MLVDLGRNDVNRICKPETVRVARLMEVERYSHVMHIVSKVQGELRDDQSALQAFRSIFPAGTVSGAPKIRAMKLVASLENERRGVYAGAVGYYSFGEVLDTCIALRTVVYRDGIAYLQAGGGIVFDSDEQAEYEETMHKMGALRKALENIEKRQDKYTEECNIYPLNDSTCNIDDNLNNFHKSFTNISIEETKEEEQSPSHSLYKQMASKVNPEKGCVLMIDNYDSFTWNVYQYLSHLGETVVVARNDEITLEECEALNPHHIVLSPGPGHPSEAGICASVLERFEGRIPILGVCLGHQVMAEYYGGKVSVCGEIKHGKTSVISQDGKGIYKGIKDHFEVIRYHSLTAENGLIPECLEITSTSEQGHIMGLRHKEYTIEGVQYHPESIKTQNGKIIFTNFLKLKSGTWKENEIACITLKDCIKKLQQKKQLSPGEMKKVMKDIMDGIPPPSQVGAFLSLLSISPKDNLITSDILKSCADVMLELAKPCSVNTTDDKPLIDIVGTGGDGKDAFNVSTAAGFIVAACGCRVVKHGNRSSSGSVGSADFLEALGINIHLDSDKVSSIAEECDFAFLFAPTFHTAMKNVASIRKEIGVKTIFNLLGPLTNPIQPPNQLSGIANPDLGPIYVKLLSLMNKKYPMVIHSLDGLDELSISSKSNIWTINENGDIEHNLISPTDFGLKEYDVPLEDLSGVTGGTANERANNFLDILNGKTNCPLYDFIVLNASLALITAKKTNSYIEATNLVKNAISSGKAKELFLRYKDLSNGINNSNNDNSNNVQPIMKQSTSILQTIASKTKEDLEIRKKDIPLESLKQKISENNYSIVRFGDRIRRAGKIAVLAEIKRASPSKGDIQTNVNVSEQALIYADSGAATISVLTEPHWFKGSLEDMELVRKSINHFDDLTRPAVLRKDFIFDEYQIYEARANGADTILLIVSLLNTVELLTPLINISRKLGMEPLVEVNSLEETNLAISVGAKVIGINNRNLNSFNVDLTTTEDILSKIKLQRKDRDILFIALSGIKERKDVERFEKIGVKAVLVGEALMKSVNPSGMIKSLSNNYQIPFVKICGLSSVESVASTVNSGADLIGLVFAKSPRQVSLEKGKELADAIRFLSNNNNNQNNSFNFKDELKSIKNENDAFRRLGRYSSLLEKTIHFGKPLIVGVFANQNPDEVMKIAKYVNIDVIQLSGSNDSLGSYSNQNDYFVFKAVHVSSDDSKDKLLQMIESVGNSCTNILLDTRDSKVSGGTGKPFDWSAASYISKSLGIPFILAGGLNIDNVSKAVKTVMPFGIDVSSGVEDTDRKKCSRKIETFIKLAKISNLPLLSIRQINEREKANNILQSNLISLETSGWFGTFGGRYAPESLMQALEELEDGYYKAINDPLFQAEVDQISRDYIGRPTPLYNAKQLSEYCNGARIWLKREDLNHTGAHKINNAIAQAILAKRLGKKRIIAETGAGQHGVATATACAMLKLECIVYMGAEDCRRQSLNVFRMKNLGATVIPVTSGSKTLKDAINEAMRDWVTNVKTTHYLVGSAIGPHPFPVIVRDFQCIIGRETKQQMILQSGKLPDAVIACVGGGSNAIGMFHPFIDEPVSIYGVEAAGEGVSTEGRHSATIVAGRPGVLHGTRTCLLQDEKGQITTTHSISAGLDYPGVGPEHAYIAHSGRGNYVPIDDNEAMNGFKLLNELEGIVPALESSHAISFAIQLAKQLPSSKDIVVCLSGRGDKDMNSVAEYQGIEL